MQQNPNINLMSELVFLVYQGLFELFAKPGDCGLASTQFSCSTRCDNNDLKSLSCRTTRSKIAKIVPQKDWSYENSLAKSACTYISPFYGVTQAHRMPLNMVEI
jgi:hypothetical protein